MRRAQRPMNSGDQPRQADLPSVAAIMPCRNERDTIESAIESVLAFDYPPDRLRLTVVDGSSDDGTRALLEDLANADSRVSILDNPERLPAPGLNMAIDRAEAEVVLRLDAHARYPTDYARLCVEAILETGAWNVGGLVVTRPGAQTPIAEAIAYAMAHPMGVGNAKFRTGVEERRKMDTVPFGCWRLETLRRVGGFATDLPFAEDDELNARISAQGGEILLDPSIRADYFARSKVSSLALQMYRYGRYKPLSGRRIGRLTSWRQLVPPAFVMVVAGAFLASFAWPPLGLVGCAALAAHLAASALVAFGARRRLRRAAAVRLPLVLLAMHLAYGLGYLIGLIALLNERDGRQ